MKIFQVDAFTSKPYRGNPAGVCILQNAEDEEWMLNVAGEMNVSETAFLHPQGDGFNLRWFTPHVEVDLCGHTTLASAHILWETGRLRRDQKAVFYTRSGTLTAQRNGEWIEMDFPSRPAESSTLPDSLLDALGIDAKDAKLNYTGITQFDYLIEVEKVDSIYDLQPDFSQLAKIDTRGIIVTARSADPAYDFISRFFAPQVGINEDPVTGSAHCSLAPYWSNQLGKKDLIGYQASSRGGAVRVRVGAADNRVMLGGQAVTVLEGEILY
ncbi:MAG: PhzF family phenazine biosynthesis protein [Archaeoglobaceae archaeon]